MQDLRFLWTVLIGQLCRLRLCPHLRPLPLPLPLTHTVFLRGAGAGVAARAADAKFESGRIECAFGQGIAGAAAAAERVGNCYRFTPDAL